MPFDHFDFIASIYSRVEYASFESMQSFADLPTGGWVLDAGGGTGRVASLVRDQAGGVVIADPSLGMLRQADGGRLSLACSNSEALPFPDETFERVIMVDALHHVAHQGATARELYRVLKRGGRIVIEEPDIRSWGVKLVAVAEKLLLMRSHFLAPEAIEGLFSFDNARTKIHVQESDAWIVIVKPR